MADPLSIGMMALQAGGAIYGAVSESGTLRENARIDEANAHLAEVDGAADALDLRRRARATQSEAMAAFGMNGVSVGTGSALDLITQNAIEAEYDILRVRYNAGREAEGLRQQAKGKRKAATGVLIGGLLGAGAQALSTAGQLDASGRARKAADWYRYGGSTMPVPGRYGSGF